jgi:hypothetical protein
MTLFKLKTSFTESRISHLDECTSMDHAHPSYAHIILQMSLSTPHLDACTSMKHAHSSYVCMILLMSLTHWVKFETKFYIQILHLCIVSSLGPEPTNPQGNSTPTLKVHSHLVLGTLVLSPLSPY